MPILVDFSCSGCGRRGEQWASSPPPAALPCPECGAPARRLFAAVGLGGRTGADAGGAVGAASTPAQTRGPTMCQQYPQIPGLCHMTPSAQRRWVAAYTKDGAATERELARQERAAAVKTPVMADAISHHHLSD